MGRYRSRFLELLGVSVVFLLVIYVTRDILIFQKKTFIHDNYYWALPIYTSFYRNFSYLYLNLSLWDPFSNGGESLITGFLQLRVFDPLTWFIGIVGKLANLTPLAEYHWDRYLKAVMGGVGLYILFRKKIETLSGKIALFSVCIFASNLYLSFIQNGITDVFYSAPYVIYFLNKIAIEKKHNWIYYLWVTLFIGITFQSYFFSPLLILLLIYLIINLDIFTRSFNNNIEKYLFSFIALTIFLLPMIVYISQYTSDLFFIARTPREAFNLTGDGPVQFFKYINLDYSPKTFVDYSLVLESGTKNSINSFLSSFFVHSDIYKQLNAAGEAYIYMGVIPLAIAFYGLLKSPSDIEARFWKVSLGIFSLLSFGSLGGLHILLYKFAPFLMQFRHVHVLLGYILMPLIYFFCIGFNELFEKRINNNTARNNAEINRSSIFAFILMISSLIADSYFFGSNYFYLDLFLLAIFSVYFISNNKLSIKIIEVLVISLKCMIILNLLRQYTVDVMIFQINYFLSIFFQIFALYFLIKISPYKKTIIISIFLITDIFIYFFNKNDVSLVSFSTTLALPILFYFSNTSKELIKNITLYFVTTLIFLELLINYHSNIYKFSTPIPPIIVGANYDLTNVEPDKKLFIANPIRKISPSTDYLFRWTPELWGQYMRYPGLIDELEYSYLPVIHHNFKGDDSSLDDAYKYGIWNSFSMNKSLIKLLYSGIDRDILQSILKKNAPIFQLKSKYIVTENLIGDISLRDKKYLLNFLDEGVFIEDTDKEFINKIGDDKLSNDVILQIEKLSPSKIILSLQAKSKSILYIADGFDKDWRATFDGKPVTIYRANGNFKAVIVPPGNSQLILTYSPNYFIYAIFGFNFIAIFLFLLIVYLSIYSKVSSLISSRKKVI